MKRVPVFAVLMLALAGADSCAQTASPANDKPVVLDHVVAVINRKAILQSDVNEEMRFGALEPFRTDAGPDTRQSALRRLINRALIEQQMKEQQQLNFDISDAEVRKSLDDLRSHLPLCVKYDCKTPDGWKAFLAANDLTSDEVTDHWKERMAILRFIDLRFRSGIRIPQDSIADYYEKSVVPVFEREHQAAPPLKDVSARIQEVLLQQQVNGLLQDWLKSLRDEGTVQIIDPAYASAVNATAGSAAGED
jgi:peptidyl-prolyl cis-trans isomerase SurA